MDIKLSSLSPIGVLDSGVGGISVLRELVALMPGEDFLYYGDSAHAPYGTKEVGEVIHLAEKAADFLLARGAKALVIACNTATSVAAKHLREVHAPLPIIGIEPAVKPAVKAKDNSRILVMATPMTLEQEKFAHMLHSYENDADILKVPCPGLVELIEQGILEGAPIRDYLTRTFQPYENETIDAVVLGCTHYPLIKNEVAAYFPHAAIYDGGPGTARQTRRRLEEESLLSPRKNGGRVTFFNSKPDRAILALSKYLLEK